MHRKMSSIGTGYDYSATTYSPDGRIYQVEYAEKAVENSGTVLGIACKDGVVIGVEKLLISKMLERDSPTNRRMYVIDRHAGLVGAGLAPDVRQLANRAREEALNYKQTYGHPVPSRVLAERLAMFVHVYTLYAPVRPFGASAVMASYDRDGPQLWMAEPSGQTFGYLGIASGKNKQGAKTELEKLNLNKQLPTCREALVHIAKILLRLRDESKDKDVDFEFGWVCDETNKEFRVLSHADAEQLVNEAKTQISREEDEEDDD